MVRPVPTLKGYILMVQALCHIAAWRPALHSDYMGLAEELTVELSFEGGCILQVESSLWLRRWARLANELLVGFLPYLRALPVH